MEMKLAAMRLTIFVFYATFGFVTPEEESNTTDIAPDEFFEVCYKAFGGVNFFAWVVRIMVRDWIIHNQEVPDETYRVSQPHYIATGNIITERHVLTACTPFVVILEENAWEHIRVLPSVIGYVNHLPRPEKGIFPWCSRVGCIVGHYHVRTGYTITDGKCDAHADDYPAVMITNFLLLEMASKIEVGEYKLFPRMPFNYNIEPLVEKIDWFNTYRKARCVIGRIKDVFSHKDNDGIYHSKFEHDYEIEGFHYGTLPYRANCAPLICEKNCSSVANTKECKAEIKATKSTTCTAHAKCLTNCETAMEPYLGTIMCLIRFHEHQEAVTFLVVSINYDYDNLQTRFSIENKCDLSARHPVSKYPLYIGAPVVCDGEVIALVTKCDKDFLIATSIVAIRHRLLKLFDTSYEDELVYLTNN